MKITCPTCNSVYNLPDHKIPQALASATCKKCGGKITITPGNTIKPADLSRISVKTQDQPLAEPDASQNAFLSSLLQEWPDLRNLDATRLDLSQILSPNKKGKFLTRQNKLKVKVLTAIQAVLPQLLGPGERILKIGKGIANYPIEWFLGNGLLTMMYNYYAIAATEKRILLVNTNSQMTYPTHYFFQIPYHNIKNVKKGSLGSHLILKPHQGKKRTLSYIKSYLLKELLAFIQEKMKQPAPVSDANDKQASDLCPSCFIPVASDLNACPECRAAFKSAKTAALRSLLLPGLGDIYLGHRLLGTMELIGSIIVWLILILSLFSGEAESLIFFFLVLVFYNGVDALVTLHMGKKGHMLMTHA